MNDNIKLGQFREYQFLMFPFYAFSLLVNLFLYDINIPHGTPTTSPTRDVFIKSVMSELQPLVKHACSIDKGESCWHVIYSYLRWSPTLWLSFVIAVVVADSLPQLTSPTLPTLNYKLEALCIKHVPFIWATQYRLIDDKQEVEKTLV